MTDQIIALHGSDGELRKIARLTRLADGGVSIIPAYESVRPGWLLIEISTNYAKVGEFSIPAEDLRRRYVTSGGIKLSLHRDGFVQFSRSGSRGLLSGTDPVTGAARAFGLDSFPLTYPPRSGPMFAMQTWGIDSYPTTFGRGNRIDIRPDSLYYQFPDRDIDRNGYALEFWPFSRDKLVHSKSRHGLVLMPPIRHPYYVGVPAEFVVVDVEGSAMCLGLVVTAMVFDSSLDSGAVLSSPSDKSMKRAMQAFSPVLSGGEDPRSADYDEAFPSLPPPRPFVEPRFHPKTILDRPWGRKR
jgi:hypothetical protein